MTQLLDTGLQVSRLDERQNQLIAAYQAIFGADINLDASSIDGQTIGITAESFNNLDMLVEAIYHCFNPDTATGAALSRLVKLNGITRNLGAYSVVQLSLTGTTGTLVPANSLVSSADGSSTWVTTVDAVIPNSGIVNVAAQATVLGAIAASANTLTAIGSPVYGWQSVTNSGQAVPGAPQETDEQLRQRRAQSTSTPAQGIVEAVYGSLLNLTGVTQVQVYENYTEVTDANGLPPHSIYAVVLGGAQPDIIQTIWLKKSAGVTLFGSITDNAIDSYGSPHPVQFDRPTDTSIYVAVNVVRRLGWPSTGVTDMQAAIVAWAIANQMIGTDVVTSELYTPINTIPGISVTSLFVGLAPAPSSSANITIPFNAIARFDASRIVINVT